MPSCEIENVEYTDGATRLEAHVAVPRAGKGRRPAVIVCHAFAGLGDLERQKAEWIASELGYVGFAIDNYGKGVFATDLAACSRLMAPFVADRAMLLRRLMAGVEVARAHHAVDPGRVATIGFCFGGMCALDL